MENISNIYAVKYAKNYEAEISGPRLFDSSLIEGLTNPAFVTGLLFEVVMSYECHFEGGRDRGTSTELILCLSWDDLVAQLPPMVKREAESWKGSFVRAEVKSVRLLDTSVSLSQNFQDALLLHLTGEDG